MVGAPHEASRWRRFVPWYDAMLLSGLAVALVSWVFDRTTDMDLTGWLWALCLMVLTLVLRPLTQRLAA